MMKRQILFFAIFLFVQQATSQYNTILNPANAGDPRVVLANPAGMAGVTSPYVFAGYQNLYNGLAASLNSSTIGLVVPTVRFGTFAVTGQNFNASLFSRSAFDLRYAYRFDRFKTGVGLAIGSLLTSYDRSGFQLIDLDDPLLSGDLSLNTVNLGLGLSTDLPYGLRAGLSFNRLNRPNTALQGEFRQDVHVRAGLLAKVGNFKPMFTWEKEDGEHYLSIGTEYWFPQITHPDVGAMARGLISGDQLSIGAALLYKNIRLDYLFDYPLTDLSAFAGATHQFVAAYTFGSQTGCEPPSAVCVVGKKVLEVARQQDAPVINPLEPKFPLGTPLFEVAGQRYYILNYNAHPYVNFFFFNQKEELDPPSMHLLANTLRYVEKRQYLDVSLTSYFYRDDNNHKAAQQRLEAVARVLSRQMSKNRMTLKMIENPQFQDEPTDEPIVLEQRRLKIDFENLSIFHSADSICTFDLSHSQAQCGWKSWLLGVYHIDEDGQKHLVWHKSGTGQPDKQIFWNWTRSLVKISDLNKTYFCTLRIEDQKGNVAVSQPDQFFIQHYPSALPKKYLLLFEFDSGVKAISRVTDAGAEASDQIKLDKETQHMLDAIADFEITGLLDIEQVIGYTDTTGLATHNQRLSQRRADAVHQYLLERGAAIDRPPVGMGENAALQLFPSDTPQGRWMNRRVEIVVRPK